MDRRTIYDAAARSRAAELYDEGLMAVGRKYARYSYETKLAAARTVVDGGMTRAGAMGGGRRDLLPHRQRVWPQADSHVPARRAGRAHSRQDRAQDDARDGRQLRDPARDRPPQVQLLQGRGGADVRERYRVRLRGGRAVAEDGHRRDRVQAAVGQGLLRAGLRLREQGDRRMVDLAAPRHGPAARAPRPAAGEEARGRRPDPASDMGWQHQQTGWRGRLEGAGIVQGMSRKGNRIDNGAAEQVFGHMKVRVLPGGGHGPASSPSRRTSTHASSIGTPGGARLN